MYTMFWSGSRKTPPNPGTLSPMWDIGSLMASRAASSTGDGAGFGVRVTSGMGVEAGGWVLVETIGLGDSRGPAGCVPSSHETTSSLMTTTRVTTLTWVLKSSPPGVMVRRAYARRSSSKESGLHRDALSPVWPASRHYRLSVTLPTSQYGPGHLST